MVILGQELALQFTVNTGSCSLNEHLRWETFAHCKLSRESVNRVTRCCDSSFSLFSTKAACAFACRSSSEFHELALVSRAHRKDPHTWLSVLVPLGNGDFELIFAVCASAIFLLCSLSLQYSSAIIAVTHQLHKCLNCRIPFPRTRPRARKASTIVASLGPTSTSPLLEWRRSPQRVNVGQPHW